MGITSREPGTVRGTARRPHFSRAFISVTVQLWTYVFWVISVYFNIRNTLPKSGTFLLGHPVYTVYAVKKCRQPKYFARIAAYLSMYNVSLNMTQLTLSYRNQSFLFLSILTFLLLADPLISSTINTTELQIFPTTSATNAGIR